MDCVRVTSLLLALLALAGCGAPPTGNRAGGAAALSLTPSSPPVELRIEALNACQADAQCVVVSRGCCGHAAALNGAHLAAWNAHLDALQPTCGRIMCEPVPPLDSFRARCVEQTCVLRDATCGPEIEDPQAYQAALADHPAVQELGRELALLEIRIPGPCEVDGRPESPFPGVEAVLRYEIPASFSAYGVVYVDDLHLLYRPEDGSLEAGYDPEGGPPSGAPEAVLASYRDRIRALESDPRVAEFLAALGWDATAGRIYLARATRVHARRGYIVFDHPFDRLQGLVTEYVLPNAVEWDAFPEVEAAHQAIQAALDAGRWPGCAIQRDGVYSSTSTFQHFSEEEEWLLNVDLVCGGAWRTATVRVFPDGSTSQPELP